MSRSIVSRPAGGVLLVGNLPEPPLVGGVEVGVEMILASGLPARHGMRLFNTARRRDPSRPLRARLAYQGRRFVELAREILRMRPRLVHVKATVGVNYWQGAGYCALARLLGRRVLLQLHGGDFDAWYQAHGRLGRLAVRAALRVASEVLVLSQYWRAFVTELGARRVRVVPNGVRVAEALPRPAAARPVLQVLTLGSLGERKGHFEILEAAARLAGRPIRFVFAGTDEFGGEGDRLRAEAARLGVSDRVVFAGAVTGREKWNLLADSDVFLLPSRGENMPNAVLEAMAAGLPVVCTPVGALREMLEDGALFVPVGDAAAIAEAVLRLLVSPTTRDAMGQRNRERAAARFSFTAVADVLDGIYAESA